MPRLLPATRPPPNGGSLPTAEAKPHMLPLTLNPRQQVAGFSLNIREIFAAFLFDDTIRDLERAGLNKGWKMNDENFQTLVRLRFLPPSIFILFMRLVLMFDTTLASGDGVARNVNDCCYGTSGMLTNAKDRIPQINPLAKVFLYRQELNPQTWAIARSDMLILEPEGKDAENIKLGSTLSICVWFVAKNKQDDKRRPVSELELALAA